MGRREAKALLPGLTSTPRPQSPPVKDTIIKRTESRRSL